MLPEHYKLSNIIEIIRDPSHLKWEYERLKEKSIHTSTKKYLNIRFGEGIDVMSKDWDNLIIFDALRYDSFAEHEFCKEMEGNLEARFSKGCRTIEFLKENIAGQDLYDTVYVTANPHIQRLDHPIFHKVIKTYDEWDADKQTILPEAVIDAAVQAQHDFPHKRLLIHFMQPHDPFIGPTGDNLREKHGIDGWGNSIVTEELGTFKFFRAARKGIITADQYEQAYEENVDIVLGQIPELIEQLSGKTILTSDHGELLGDRIWFKQRFGHENWHTVPLCKVPWFELPSDTRPDISEDPPEPFEPIDQNTVQNRLEKLGYLNN